MDSPTPAPTPQRPPPSDTVWEVPVTSAIFVLCIGVFVLENVNKGAVAAQLNPWIAPDAFQIWKSHLVWGLVSSAFVHVAIWHLAFNLSWAWQLGKRMERGLGHGRFALFILLSAIVSSGFELAVGGTMGIGFSGVGYALFGFLWVAQKRDGRFGKPLSPQTIGMAVIWLFACLILSGKGTIQIGNAAHFSGFAFGVLGGWWYVGERRGLSLGGLGAMATVAVVSCLWAPWSSSWQWYRAGEAYSTGRYEDALAGYQRSLAMGGQKTLLLQNIGMVRLRLGDLEGYDRTIDELRKIDFVAAEHAHAELRQLEISAMVTKANSAFKQHEWKSARDLYDRAYNRGGDAKKLLPWIARSSYAFGDRKRFDSALSELDAESPEDAAQLRAEYQVQAEDSPK